MKNTQQKKNCKDLTGEGCDRNVSAVETVIEQGKSREEHKTKEEKSVFLRLVNNSFAYFSMSVFLCSKFF